MTSEILAFDPGLEQTAWLRLDVATSKPVHFGLALNTELVDRIADINKDGVLLAIERIECFGMPVGREVFETAMWIGRFIQAWNGQRTLVSRTKVKLHLCRSARAKDAHIRQALLDRYGRQGTKKQPGPLYGITSHIWSALAIATYTRDTFGVATDGR